MAGWGVGGPGASLVDQVRAQYSGAPYRITGSIAQPASGGIGMRNPPSTTAMAPAAWTQPPIPTAAYNPIRDIELAAGKRGTQNTIEDDTTKEAQDNSNLLLNTEGVQREEGEQQTAEQKALSTLAESYKKLGVSQEQGANKAGVLRGGALLQAAQKRAANEGVTKGSDEQALQTQLTNDQIKRGQLTLTNQRELEALLTSSSRAEREQAQFGVDTKTLEAREASENGYVAPTPPKAVVSAPVRVASSRAQPASAGKPRIIRKGW